MVLVDKWEILNVESVVFNGILLLPVLHGGKVFKKFKK